MNKDVHKMALHDEVCLNTDGMHTTITRVPGGWLYTTLLRGGSGGASSCFVPYSDEFDSSRRHTFRIGPDGSVIHGE